MRITDPQVLGRRFNIDARVNHEVVESDPEARTVAVRDLATGRMFTQAYDKLVLAPGADPVLPPVAGLDLPFVFSFKTLADTDALQAFIEKKQPQKALVVGGGLIGIEMVENLVQRGMQVTVVEFLEQPLVFLDPEMALHVTARLQSHGVEMRLGEKVSAIDADGTVRLADGGAIATDLVIMSVGIRPNVALARRAGLAIGATGGIEVDEYMQTSDPHIYAAGDCVEKVNLVTGRKQLLPMGAAANKEGRAAGANAVGRRIAVQGYTGTVIVKVFDLAVARTGLSEQEAVREGFEPLTTYVLAGHHADYYPGARLLRMKIIADRQSGRLLGGQVIGEQGVDKRIDVLACALYNRMRAEDLLHLDLAYAPPFGSARDPILVAGMLHQNSAAGDWQPVTPAWLRGRQEAGADLQIVDLRTSAEIRRTGIIAGAVHIPVDELRERIAELDAARETILYCAIGQRSYIGSRILTMNGFEDVKTLTGGVMSWPYGLETVEGGSRR